jgi:hypothetical protein
MTQFKRLAVAALLSVTVLTSGTGCVLSTDAFVDALVDDLALLSATAVQGYLTGLEDRVGL